MENGLGPRDLISIATVARAHGIKGSVRVQCDPSHVDFFRTLPAVSIGGKAHRITQVRGTDDAPIIDFEGIESRNDSESIRGLTIDIAREDLPEREEDEFLVAELQGCDVRDLAGKSIGTVVKVRILPANDVLDVLLHDGGEVLVPFIKLAVPVVDAEARVLTVDPEFLGIVQ
ncbi:MAG: 16S rRNA processing protein RimM [Thermoleophilia bacterium]|nr:16S rRNA processing protein RimM [Thermoleophilia bacterium]